MGDDAGTPGTAPRVILVGLGPGDPTYVPAEARPYLADPSLPVVVRTLDHPAAAQLADSRPVTSCDDLYEQADDFDHAYRMIADRVLELARHGTVVYAVPGSPRVGETAARILAEEVAAEGIPVEIIDAPSFLDLVWERLRIDPLADGFRLIDAHRLPNPLVVDAPTVIAQVDTPELLADLAVVLDRALPEDTPVTVLSDLGGPEEQVETFVPAAIPPDRAGLRTSLFIPATHGGWVGAVQVMRRLRAECPWDRRQTHSSLVEHLIEEAFELVDAISRLPEETDWVAYSELEEELGDVLLQILFHTVIAAERGAFDVDDVGERLRRKLVRRHPHVFGDVEVADAAEVKRNWDRIKAEEKGEADSLLDGVPRGMPALSRAVEIQQRAAKVGFDWPDSGGVVEKIREELEELTRELDRPQRAAEELGDLLFSVVNLARRLGADPEVVLRRATERFERRFREMERMGPMEGVGLEELDRRWEAVKESETGC